MPKKDNRLKAAKFCISVPAWASDQIDKKRGKIPKSTFIRLMLEHHKVIERPDYAEL